MRLAIITGGSQRLGAALCDAYLARGWEVVEFSRSAPHPFSVSSTSRALRPQTTPVSRRSRRCLGASTDEIVAISNAAVLGPVGPVENAPAGRHRGKRRTPTSLSAILFARAFVAAFQDHDCPKTFVNISSGAAVKGYAGWSLYCAGKAAMENYVRSIALEQNLRQRPVRALNVNPGVMDTEMQAAVRAASIEDFPTLERFVGLKRDGLLATPSQVAVRIVDVVASRPESGSLTMIARVVPGGVSWREDAGHTPVVMALHRIRVIAMSRTRRSLIFCLLLIVISRHWLRCADRRSEQSHRSSERLIDNANALETQIAELMTQVEAHRPDIQDATDAQNFSCAGQAR